MQEINNPTRLKHPPGIINLDDSSDTLKDSGFPFFSQDQNLDMHVPNIFLRESVEEGNIDNNNESINTEINTSKMPLNKATINLGEEEFSTPVSSFRDRDIQTARLNKQFVLQPVGTEKTISHSERVSYINTGYKDKGNESERGIGGIQLKDQICTICYDNNANAVLMKCGHGAICFDCALRLTNTSTTCHICRNVYIYIYINIYIYIY